MNVTANAAKEFLLDQAHRTHHARETFFESLVFAVGAAAIEVAEATAAGDESRLKFALSSYRDCFRQCDQPR